jgi:hypothetical protein
MMIIATCLLKSRIKPTNTQVMGELDSHLIVAGKNILSFHGDGWRETVQIGKLRIINPRQSHGEWK